MKNFRLLLGVLGVFAITSSCADSSTNNTWHPSDALVTVVTDFGTSAIAEWDDYTIRYNLNGGPISEIHGNSRVQDLPLKTPGTYQIEIFTNGKGFTYNDNVVTVNETVAGSGILVSSPNDLGYLYTGSGSVTAVKDQNIQAPITMKPHMRRLNVQIYLLNDQKIITKEYPSGYWRPVKTVTAKMTGVAGSYNTSTGAYSNSSSVELPFITLTNPTTQTRYLNCDLNMLGIIGSNQTLTLEIEFDFGPGLVAEPKNFNSDLAGFNNMEELSIQGSVNVALAPTGEVAIEEYTVSDEGDIDVNESAYTYSVGDRYPHVEITSDPLGVVVWATSDGQHGLVLGGEETPAPVTWARTAGIGGTTWEMGVRNTANLETWLSGRPNEDMGAIRWMWSTYGSYSGWFLPARAEMDIVFDELENNNLEATLTLYGFPGISGTYWTSETVAQHREIEGDDSSPLIPAKTYIWNSVDGTYELKQPAVTTSSGGIENTTWEYNKARVMRFF